MKAFVHLYVRRKGYDWPFCRMCGAVKRADGRLTPCGGRVRLSLRW